MSYNVGFYQPEAGGDGKEDRGRSNKKSDGPIDFRVLFVLITEKTGWTPQEIGELTIGQINEYIKGWNDQNRQSNSGGNLDEHDIKMFHLASGLKVIKKK